VSYTYDEQLIDAVLVRRSRLIGAFLHGSQRLRHRFSDQLMTYAVSVGLAALVAAVCVGVSFVTDLLARAPR